MIFSPFLNSTTDDRIAHKLIRYMTRTRKISDALGRRIATNENSLSVYQRFGRSGFWQHLVERFREIVPHQTDIIELENIGHFPHFETSRIVLENFLNFTTQNLDRCGR